MKIYEIVTETKLDKPTPSVAELVKKHNVSSSHIKSQLAKGTKVELEHTSDRKVAREIALDHIGEDPNYYTKLSKMEEAISRDELIANISAKQKQRMLDAIFMYLDKAVKSDPEKDVRKHAFQVGREVDLSGVGLNPRMLSRQYSQKTGIPESFTESNDFTDARMNAIKAGKSSFKVGGKTYKVTGDTTDELNAEDPDASK